MARIMKSEFLEYLAGHGKTMAGLEDLLPSLEKVCVVLADTLAAGKRIWLAGNGGSAADAQHIAGEMEGRFLVERKARAVHTLGANSSTMSAVANDYGFESVFARQVEGFVEAGDLLWLISSSGNSPNLVAAADAAGKKGVTVLGLLGKGGGAVAPLCDHLLNVPADFTPWIQEAHITLGHMICRQVDVLLEAGGREG